MYSNTPRPKWWQVYLTFPLLIALFILDSHLKISEHEHLVMQTGILLLIYGLIHLWLKANATALSEIDQKQFHSAFTVIRIPPYQISNSDKRPMFQSLNSEIKGTLGNTFEMDYIDAEFSSVDEAPQELNKE